MSAVGILRMMAAAAVALSFASAAGATTVTLTDGLQATLDGRDGEAWAKVDAAKSTALPTGAAWAPGTSIWELPSTTFPIDAAGGDPCRNACSPFYGGVFGGVGPAAQSAAEWEDTSFWVVFDPHTAVAPWTNTAELRFTGLQSSLSLLWGSPDRENLVELVLGGTSVASFWGADFDWFSPGIVQTAGRGAALLTLSGVAFDAVRFTTFSDKGSFEFSNISAVSAVPVPASLLLLLSGFAAIAMVGRKRHA